MLAQIGLVTIAAAWLVQLIYALLNKKDIRPEFIVLYMIGVGFLVASTIQSNTWTTISYFEASTFVAAGLVLIKRLIK
ncbi:MAG: hypothetical protein WCT53_04415 [Candidatus Gracilibacteria bacterium]|jgi:hypothetical protein